MVATDAGAKMTEAEGVKHVARMCTNAFENFDLYVTSLGVRPDIRFKMIELVLVNAMAKHMLGMENVYAWREQFSSIEEFRAGYDGEMRNSLAQALAVMRKVSL